MARFGNQHPARSAAMLTHYRVAMLRFLGAMERYRLAPALKSLTRYLFINVFASNFGANIVAYAQSLQLSARWRFLLLKRDELKRV
jgi:hypothetical protein